MASPENSATPVEPARLSWPVFLLVCLLLFEMIVRGTSILYPWRDWVREFEMDRMPRGLPTRKELSECASRSQAWEEFGKSAASLGPYWNPLPNENTRTKLRSNLDWFPYGVAWTVSRLRWCESIAHISQEWAMFSPSVGEQTGLARARLRFEDGTEKVVNTHSEPDDFTSFLRRTMGKRLIPERFLFSDSGLRWWGCRGYCNLLEHRFPRNENGSRLRAIMIYEFMVEFVPPGADAVEHLRAQMHKMRHESLVKTVRPHFLYLLDGRRSIFIDRDAADEPAELTAILK